MSDVFYFFRQSPLRRDLIQGRQDPAGAGYLLYGMNHLARQNLTASHNLSLTADADLPQRRLAHWLGFMLEHGGGLAGDFQTVFDHRRTANECRVILASVDTVGLPLAMMSHLGLIRTPGVYIRIG